MEWIYSQKHGQGLKDKNFLKRKKPVGVKKKYMEIEKGRIVTSVL